MEENDIYPGSVVYIIDSKNTQTMYGWSSFMDEMLKTTQIVERIQFNTTTDSWYASIRGYKWDINDLKLVSNEKAKIDLGISIGNSVINFDPIDLDIPVKP